MRFEERVYGPHPLVRGSRVLLAVPGRDYTDAEGQAIIAASGARAARTSAKVPETVEPVAPVAVPEASEADEEAETAGPRPLGGGWYELPDGSRVRGRDAAYGED